MKIKYPISPDMFWREVGLNFLRERTGEIFSSTTEATEVAERYMRATGWIPVAKTSNGWMYNPPGIPFGEGEIDYED